jgi:hypothetical protein
LWSHPDLLPSASDLDDPIGFAQHAGELADIDISDFMDQEDGGDKPSDGPSEK